MQAEPYSQLPRARRALVVVDVVESVRLMQAHEADVIDRWRLLVADVHSDLLPAFAGRLVKSLGDGLLMEFTHATPALAAARELLRRVSTLNVGRPPSEHIELRVGLHVSEVVSDQFDIYGAGVNLTARLSGIAGPGQAAMSQEFLDALDAAVRTADVLDLGLCYLKHIDHPVRVFRTGRAVVVTASEPQPSGRVGEGGAPTLAVLPFEPAGPQSDDRVAAELLADALVARLAVCPGINVISRFSTRGLGAPAASGAAAWSELKAHYVVRGRMGQISGRLLASVELVDSADERVLWAGRVPLHLSDLLDPDDDVSLQLANELARQVAEERLRRARTSALPSLDGNLLQFSASSLMHQRDLAAFARAQVMLEHLIDRFPRLPSPRAWSAMWYVLQVTRGIEHDPSRVADRALDHVHRALDHDPGCALALAMGGFVQCHLRRDLSAADALLSQAVLLNPNEAWAWLFRSVVAGHRGQAAEAWDWASRASMLSPLDPLRHYFEALRATAAVAAGRWDDAVTLARRSLAITDNHLPTLRGLAIALVSLGRLDEARTVGARILALDPGFTLQGYLGAAPPDGVETRRRYVDLLARAGLPLR